VSRLTIARSSSLSTSTARFFANARIRLSVWDSSLETMRSRPNTETQSRGKLSASANKTRYVRIRCGLTAIHNGIALRPSLPSSDDKKACGDTVSSPLDDKDDPLDELGLS